MIITSGVGGGSPDGAEERRRSLFSLKIPVNSGFSFRPGGHECVCVCVCPDLLGSQVKTPISGTNRNKLAWVETRLGMVAISSQLNDGFPLMGPAWVSTTFTGARDAPADPAPREETLPFATGSLCSQSSRDPGREIWEH